MPATKQYHLGSVVTLKTNYLINSEFSDLILIGGNENFTTPLMIITEVLGSPSKEIDINTGQEITVDSYKSSVKYKCTYFSSKVLNIESNWFKHNELLEFETTNDTSKKYLNDIKLGDTVRFKTVDEESKKLKSSNNDFSSTKRKNQKPLLTYSSPAFLVTGFSSSDKKESLIDNHTGNQKRWISDKIVKCKFHNVSTDKFSEISIPVECLEKINNVNLDERLIILDSAKKCDDFVIINAEDEILFGKINEVIALSGRYQLSLKSELNKQTRLVWIDKITKTIERINSENKNIFSGHYPGFNESNTTKEFINLEQYLKKNISTFKSEDGDLFLKIRYRNLKEQVTSRYIKVKNVVSSLSNHVVDEKSVEKETLYLDCYCFLRSANRLFNAESILSISPIKNKSLESLLTKIAATV